MARVLWIGTFDPQFSRNRKLARLLRIGGHDVDLVDRPIWGTDRVAIPTASKVGLARRAVVAYAELIWRCAWRSRPDVILISYPGWFDVLVLAPLARIRRVPLVFDIFISLHDTVVADRQQIGEGSVLARVMRLVDRWSIKLADLTIADTTTHGRFFADVADVGADRIRTVWLGADDQVFVPQDDITPDDDLVVFHGTFIRLQGLETIARAAKLLEADGIRLRILGSGQEQSTLDSILSELAPTNVELVGMVPLDEVPREIAAAGLCLGIFGTTPKASRVVPNKLYECLAVGRPVLTADTPAIAETFDGEVAVVRAGDPQALALSIRGLLADRERREELARRGHERYKRSFHEERLADAFGVVIAGVVEGGSRRRRPAVLRRRPLRHRPGVDPRTEP